MLISWPLPKIGGQTSWFSLSLLAFKNLFKIKWISIKLCLIPRKCEKLRENARPGLIVDEKKKKKKNNCRIPPKEFLNVCKAQGTDRSSWQSYYIRQLSKLAVVRTYSLSSSALSNILQLLHCICKVLTIQATRSLWIKCQSFGCALLSPGWAGPVRNRTTLSFLERV